MVEEGRAASIAVVHVDDIFVVSLESRCDVFRDELNRVVPVKNLGELRWYGGCHYTREWEMGTLTISQKAFADELVRKSCVTSQQSVPLRVGVKLEEFGEDERVENWPFHELVGSLMWLSILTRPDISNAVRAVARYRTAPRAIYWKAALGILEYINETSERGITFQRGALSGSLLDFQSQPLFKGQGAKSHEGRLIWLEKEQGIRPVSLLHNALHLHFVAARGAKTPRARQ